MTVRHLFIFKTVCEEMSFTKAAQRLFMTQPAVSHVISDLEKEAGTPLFARQGGKIGLNGRGKLLLEKSARLLELYGETKEVLMGLETRGTLRIGSSITIANDSLPGFIKRFEALCPDTPLSVEVDSALHTAEKLRSGELDLALVEGAFHIGDFEKLPFSSYDIIPVCAPEFIKSRVGDLSGGSGPELAQLVGMRLLLREKGSAVRDIFDGLLQQKELKAEPFLTSVNSQALLKAALSGMGVAILPEMIVRKELEAGELTELEIEDFRLQNTNYIIFHKTQYMTGPVKKFISVVIESD